jgi:SH3-like domain-containing protein
VRRLLHVAAFATLIGVTTVAAAIVLDRDLDHAVVVERKTAPVRVSPFDTAASEVALSEGEEVSIIGRHGDFVRVRDGQGRRGWVQSSAVQFVVPRRS